MIKTPEQVAILKYVHGCPYSLIVDALPGCLSGDTIVEVNRGGKSFSLSIAELVKKQNSLVAKPNRAKARWSGEACWAAHVQTKIRSRDPAGYIQLFDLTAALDSGIKETYLVKTGGGRSIRATASHPFLTTTGWKTLRELRVGTMLLADGGLLSGQKAPRQQYITIMINGIDIPQHRLVVEADLNGMTLGQYIKERRAGLRALYRLGDRQVVHHKNGDIRDNRRSNLELVDCQATHARHHGHESAWRHLTPVVAPVRVASIREYKAEPTFDLTVAGPENFLANGLVVHNTGKTTTLIECIKILPQASAVVLAFNRLIADEMATRMPPLPRNRVVHVKTLHAAGLWITTKHFPKLKLDRESTERIIDKACEAGTAFKVRGAAFKLLRLVKDFQHDAVLDADYAFYLGSDFGVFDKLEGKQVQTAVEVTQRAYAASLDVANRDGIDFPDMGWLPLVLGLEPPHRYKAILLDEAQDVNANQLAMVERLLAPGGRIIAAGDLNQCHPAGTLVEITGGERVAIEDVKPGMHVVSYHDEFRGLASQGRKVLDVGVRDYVGEMLTLSAGGEMVRVTPNHRVPTRFVDDETPRWALYLMEYGHTSRLGCCQLRYSNSFGPSMRARHEGVDRCWVLAVFEDGDEALIQETLVSLEFGIPEHIFKEKGAYKQRLLDAIGNNRDRAQSCLRAYGRRYEHPLYTKGEGVHVARTYSYVTESCNLIEGINQLRTFDGTRNGGTWANVSIQRKQFAGNVYSLSVEPTEGGRRLYVADRILVHNCIYGWRGAVGTQVWETLRTKFGASSLPLTVTWRCDRAIVDEARKLIPDFKARPDAGRGSVVSINERSFYDVVGTVDGSVFVLSRTNAELLRVALEMWKRKLTFNITQSSDVLTPIKAVLKQLLKGDNRTPVPKKEIDDSEIDGALAAFHARRQFGNQMVKLTVTGQVDPNVFPAFRQSLAAWYMTEMMKAQAAGSISWAERIDEQHRMLLYCLNYVRSPFEIEGLLDGIFERDDTCWLTLSTVHKAKGLEADQVFLLRETFMRYQGLKDRDGNPIEIPQEEINIEIVAGTRAKQALTWVRLGVGIDE